MPLNRFRIRLPSLLAGRYVRYVTGFGVAVGVGMAPFLGKYKILLFESLLELFPEDSKRSLIPISAFLMGLVAVAVQFYSGEVILRESIRRRFTFGFAVILLAFVGLVILYQPKHVLPVPDPSTRRNEPVILGWSRLPKGKICPCETTESDLECVYAIGIPYLDICWPSIPEVQSTLHLLYLTLMGGFGGLIGLLLLQEEARRQEEEARQREEETRRREEEARRQAKKKRARKQGKTLKPAGPTAPEARAAAEAPGAPEEPPEGADRSGAAPENSDFDDD